MMQLYLYTIWYGVMLLSIVHWKGTVSLLLDVTQIANKLFWTVRKACTSSCQELLIRELLVFDFAILIRLERCTSFRHVLKLLSCQVIAIHADNDTTLRGVGTCPLHYLVAHLFGNE